MPSFELRLARAGLALGLLSLVSVTAYAARELDTACVAALEDGPRVAVAPAERALSIPMQLGFVELAAFEKTIEDLIPLVQRRFEDGKTEQWVLSLVQIVPSTTRRAIATFTARETAHATSFGDEKRGNVTVNVVFAIKTGAIDSVQISEEGHVADPGTEVSLGGKSMNVIRTHAQALPRMVQQRDFRSPANAQRAADQTHVDVARVYGAQDSPKTFVDVRLRTLIEDDGGGLSSRHWKLVYTVEPNTRVRLKAVDAEELKPYLEE